MAGFDMSDYVDVAERERQLFARYPDARIQVHLDEVRNGTGELIAWKCKATVWRSADDPLPVCDWAVEPVPGKTPFTRDSEAMNASTSAVGRAIVLAGFETKKIASANEVRARQEEPKQQAAPPESSFKVPGTPASDPQKNKLRAIVGTLEREKKINREQLNSVVNGDFDEALKTMTKLEASGLIERLEKYQANLAREQVDAAA